MLASRSLQQTVRHLYFLHILVGLLVPKHQIVSLKRIMVNCIFLG